MITRVVLPMPQPAGNRVVSQVDQRVAAPLRLEAGYVKNDLLAAATRCHLKLDRYSGQ